MLILHVALHALGTETPLVEGEVLPRLKTYHPVIFHFELNATLLSAKAAMGLYDPVRFNFRVPAGDGNAIQSRAKLRDQLRNGYWRFGHRFSDDFALDITRAPWSRHLPSCAMASDFLRQDKRPDSALHSKVDSEFQALPARP